MGKAAKNEGYKLQATFFNNLSIGLLLGGVLIPYLALVQKGIELLQWLDPMITGVRPVTNEDVVRIVFIVLPLVLALTAAYYFRGLAQKSISKVED